MKVIFTDVDGVYNNPPLRDIMKYAVDMDRVTAVQDVGRTVGAKFVISSSWRVTNPVQVKALGFDLHEDWRTTARDDRNRGMEVMEYLDRHPEITQYAIIDDNNDFTEDQQPRLVWTKTAEAISPEDIAKLAELMFDKMEMAA